jgi:hypothetical protein
MGFGLLLSAVSLVSCAQVQNAGSGRSGSVVSQVKSPSSDSSSGMNSNANANANMVAPVAPPAPGANAGNSTISELQALIQSRTLNELRTTYNGNYGASLLFKSDDLIYYVAMFQQKNFWRVIKTTSESQAEQVYKAFVDQTVQLADVDIRRIKLDAERANTEKLISTNESRLNALQNDVSVQRQQEQQVAARQEQARQEAASLANDRQVAREQLTTLQRQIRSLEDQQAKVDNMGIPGAPSASDPGTKRTTSR